MTPMLAILQTGFTEMDSGFVSATLLLLGNGD
jgi:hypothetical protein